VYGTLYKKSYKRIYLNPANTDVYICYKYVLFYAHIFIIVNYEKMNEKETKRIFIDVYVILCLLL